MSSHSVLVDSSFYIHESRNRRNPLKLIAGLVAKRELIICGIVRCEVGRGLRENSVRQSFQRIWDVMSNIPTNNSLWQEAENLSWNLDRQGIILPLADVLIACCAARANAVILTHDQHFARIPGCRVAFSLTELD